MNNCFLMIARLKIHISLVLNRTGNMSSVWIGRVTCLDSAGNMSSV